MLNSKPGPNLQAFGQATFPSPNAADAGQLERQTQSISLLDRLLSVTRTASSNKENKLGELAELDSKIRHYLEVVMSGLERRQTLICFQVALCVR
jgi:hypothetical protein